MNIKELLINLKEALSINRNYEFNAEFENHEVGNGDNYRLYYMDYRRAGEGYREEKNNLHITDWPFKPFKFPNGMTREDGFKVLSYLTDYIERELNIGECTLRSVCTLDDVISLERLGFTRVSVDKREMLEKVIDLYTVNGRILLFKQSAHYPRYIEWYTEGVTLEEVQAIYDKIGMEFYDLVWGEESTLTLQKN